ncbi:hypothetical protein BDV95DRAFT_463697, partial [Massariosphaeria phaeospora]
RLVPAVLLFVALVLVYRLHSVSSRDPTSLFFNPRTGYTPSYSAFRKQQALEYISAVENGTISSNQQGTGSPDKMLTGKKLCVGIPSIARNGTRYLRDAVGSLLEGLTPEERAEIYLMVFIPHSDPSIHPAYTEHWLEELADEILTYNVMDSNNTHIQQMEEEGGLFLEKGLYDYSYLVTACHKRDTPYITVFEDDIVAMDGWYHRTMAGIEQAEQLSALTRASPEFLYLRLFYTEEFLGWNSENAGTYLLYSSLFLACPAALLLLLRFFSPLTKRLLTDRVIYIVGGTTVTCILLFFALGRATVRPLPAGINYMPQYGCCSQGFVFPRDKAMTLINYYRERRVGFVDVITEEYADQHDELRWALTPSVIQHVGGKSSKVDDYGPASKHGRSVAEKIWNFGFEKFDPQVLKAEH